MGKEGKGLEQASIDVFWSSGISSVVFVPLDLGYPVVTSNTPLKTII